MLVTTGCGRISLTAPGPTRAPLLSPNRPVPTDLRAAERATRELAGVAAEAPMVMCALSPFDAQGRPMDDSQTTVVARFARPGGNRPALRTVYMDFQGKAKTFWGAVDYTGISGMHLTYPDAWLPSHADAVALDAAKLPSTKTAIGWARAAGLTGEAFMVEYKADHQGTLIAVGRWEHDGDVSRVVDLMAFDPSGHKLAADEAEDTEP
jgi:hypothetical protein